MVQSLSHLSALFKRKWLPVSLRRDDSFVNRFGIQHHMAALYDKVNSQTLVIGRKSAMILAIGLGVFFSMIYLAYSLAFVSLTYIPAPIVKADCVSVVRHNNVLRRSRDVRSDCYCVF